MDYVDLISDFPFRDVGGILEFDLFIARTITALRAFHGDKFAEEVFIGVACDMFSLPAESVIGSIERAPARLMYLARFGQ